MRFLGMNNGNEIKLSVVMSLTALPEIVSFYSREGGATMLQLRLSLLLSLSLFYFTSFKTLRLKGRRAFFFLILWMYFVSLFHVTPSIPLLSVFVISSLILCGVISKRLPLDLIGKSFSILAIIYSIILLWNLARLDIDIAAILRRGYAWTDIFVINTLTTIWPICLFSAYLLRKRVWIALVLLLICVITNSLTLKRAIFVDLSIAVFVILYVSWKIGDKNTYKLIIKIGVPIVIVLSYFLLHSAVSEDVSKVSDAISDRFSNQVDDISSFDRLMESNNYFSKEASLFDIVMGSGFFSAHHGIKESELCYLHIGWANIVFKGGFLLLSLLLISEIKAFRILSKAYLYTKETVFSAMICVFFFFSFFYVNYMAFGPMLFFFFYSLMQVQNPVRIPENERNFSNNIIVIQKA